MTLIEWTEADGTIYRLNIDGDYDVIPPVKKSKVKKSVKKSANTKKGN
tara:strand:- start:2332 stop:2475 length:144 start_codon:yes stop_codon:yes gene_type:complete